MPTFYVSALNASTINTVVAAFTGAVTAQVDVYDDTVKAGTAISVAGMQSAFKIFTTSAATNDANSADNVTGVAKAVVTDLFTQSAANRVSGRPTFLECQAQNVFGSTEATDMLSNAESLMDEYDTRMNVIAAAMTASTSTTASEELYKSMLSQVPARFGMDFNATTAGDAGVYGTEASALTVVQTGGSNATATVELSADNTVGRITIITAGSSYGTGSDITIANGGAGGTVTILAANITPLHVAMLNGTLDNSSGTGLPILAGDKIRAKATIFPAAAQTTVAGGALHDNNIPYTTHIDFTVAS
tara:strand:+ start:42 stop:953 length:912 start_codon:yes stop_codon:yes gene_type:complete